MTIPETSLLEAPSELVKTDDADDAGSARDLIKIGGDYELRWPAAGVRMALTNPEKEKDGLFCEYEVWAEGGLNGRGRLVEMGRTNTTSEVTRERLAKKLSSRTDVPQAAWEETLLWVGQQLKTDHRKGTPFVDQSAHTPRPVRLAVAPFIPAGDTSLLYGDSGSFKSWEMEAMLTAIAFGHPIGPFVPKIEGPVLLLDWETNADEHNLRLRRLCMGLGEVRIPPGLFHYRGCQRPLVDDIQEVARYVEEHKIVAVGVDSIAWAIGRDIKTEDHVLGFFNALQRLGPGVVRIVVSHITKDDAKSGGAGVTPYGSTFIKAAARSAVEVRRGEEVLGQRRVPVGNYQGKVNSDAKQKPIAFEIDFDDRTVATDDGVEVRGPVTFHKIDLGDAPPVLRGESLHQQIRSLLAHGARPLDAIASETGKGMMLIKDALERMSDVAKLDDGRYGLRSYRR